MSDAPNPWSTKADAKGYTILHHDKDVYQVVSIADPLTNAQRADAILRKVLEIDAEQPFDPQALRFLAWWTKPRNP